MTPIWVSENGNSFPINRLRRSQRAKTGAHCFDKGSFRGACFFSAERNYTQVNALHREIGCGAFRVSGLYLQGFATLWPLGGNSLFRERPTGVRREPTWFLSLPGIPGENSRTLELTGGLELTSGFLSEAGFVGSNRRRICVTFATGVIPRWFSDCVSERTSFQHFASRRRVTL